MDIFFQDPSEIPLPPAEVRIRSLRAEAWSDGQRVSVYLEVDPFQKRPNADLRITNPLDEEVASASIIESMDHRMELTMHLRGRNPEGTYTLSAVLFYAEQAETGEGGQGEGSAPSVIQVVDRAETTFDLPPNSED